VRRWGSASSRESGGGALDAGKPIRGTRDLLSAQLNNNAASSTAGPRSPNAVLAAAAPALRGVVAGRTGPAGSGFSAIALLRASASTEEAGARLPRLNAAAAKPKNSGSPSPNRTTHWSHLPPLGSSAGAEGEGANTGGGSGNGGSLFSGELDEDAERAAFQAAVAAWRRAGPSKSAEGTSSVAAVAGGGDLWVNPFAAPAEEPAGGALLAGTLDEDAEAAAFQDAVKAWRAAGGGGGSRASAAVDTSPRREAAGHGQDGQRVACYQCLRLFFVAAGVRAPSMRGVSSSALFCSTDCVMARNGALAAREAELALARDSIPQDIPMAPTAEFDLFAAAAAAGESLVESPISPPPSLRSIEETQTLNPLPSSIVSSPLSPLPRLFSDVSFESFDSLAAEAEAAAQQLYQ
jgi:hypothetical protein